MGGDQSRGPPERRRGAATGSGDEGPSRRQPLHRRDTAFVLRAGEERSRGGACLEPPRLPLQVAASSICRRR
jgi:hypothetical protein